MIGSTQHNVYESWASALLKAYEDARGLGLDSDVKGTQGEQAFLSWLHEWLPSRVEPLQGAVISTKRSPTNQMDCLLFDRAESPVFYRQGSSVVVPIEGVLGNVEINTGEHASYTKILRDAEKLDSVAQLAADRQDRLPIPMSHIPAPRDISTITGEDLRSGLTYHHVFGGKPLLLVFVEDLQGRLEELGPRIADHNKGVGVRRSVDGVFVLKQGYILHVDPAGAGWTTQRLEGNSLACASGSPGEVLLKLQSVVLQYLHQHSLVHPGGFDRYMSTEHQGRDEVAAATRISDSDYQSQADPGSVRVY